MIVPSNRVRIMVATSLSISAMVTTGWKRWLRTNCAGAFTGTVFVFRSRKADRLKLIYWDGSGLMMA